MNITPWYVKIDGQADYIGPFISLPIPAEGEEIVLNTMSGKAHRIRKIEYIVDQSFQDDDSKVVAILYTDEVWR